MKRAGTLLLLLAWLTAYPAPGSSEDVVLQAMQAELKRSMEHLQLEELAKPYFISYSVDDHDSLVVGATFGSLESSFRGRARRLTAEVRVGGYEMDNTNFRPSSRRPSGMLRGFGARMLPLDEDLREIRRQMWLVTDMAYKDAVEMLSLKRAALQNRTRTEEIADFSREEPFELVEPAPPFDLDRAEAESLVRDLSAVFKEMPEVHASSVHMVSGTTRTRYVNSEGTRYDRTTPSVGLVVLGQTQAPDGLPLADFVTAFGRRPGDLPSVEELKGRVRAMGKRLAGLRAAPLAERYNGPVLFEGQAAAELFLQGFIPKLVAMRTPVAEDPRRATRPPADSFQDRVGARVLPRFLRVVDDPTRAEFGGRSLIAAYRVDDQGVPASETKLVERGILKTLLTDRTPVRGISRSTGNSRGGGLLPSNVIVTAERALTAEELKEELLLEMADRELEWGLVVRRMGNREALQAHGVARRMRASRDKVLELTEVYKVFPDGREELIRNAEISGLVAATFKDIIAATEEPFVYSAPFMMRRVTGPANAVVSVVVPSVLLEDLTVDKPGGEIPTPPVAPHPYFEPRSGT